MDDAYKHKLDLMIEKKLNRTDDVVLPVDGDEGQGKTEFACGTCYYIAHMTKRTYDTSRIFFDLDELIKFASTTKEQIIHFDEAVLGLLATNWQNKLQQKFIQLVMVARKKKHFIVLCIPKFHRLPSYVIEERAIGLVHVYSRGNIEKGRFAYFTKKKKDLLYHEWRKRKTKNYRGLYSLRGSFPKVMEKIFTEEEIEEYERKKDEAILSINNEKKNNSKEEYFKKQRNLLLVVLKKELNLSNNKISKMLNQYGLENMKMSNVQKILTTTPAP